jgi:hypothetical protein
MNVATATTFLVAQATWAVLAALDTRDDKEKRPGVIKGTLRLCILICARRQIPSTANFARENTRHGKQA